MTLLTSTPRRDGFRMPGEFEPHAGCWMIWPQRPDVWREKGRPAQAAYCAVATAIAQFEPVTILVSDKQLAKARNMLPAHISLLVMPSDDAWLRDSGPTFVINDSGSVRGVDWGFNAYGGFEDGLYFPWNNDALLAARVLAEAGVARYKAPMILEGGAIHVDGQGTLLTTPNCIINDNRNPDLTQSEIETVLQDYLNVDKIFWLDCDVEGDETGGHVDQLACFARPGEVVLSWTDERHSVYYDLVRRAYDRLASTTDARGRHLKIHKLMLPEPMFLTATEAAGIKTHDGVMERPAGMPLADCYINFYIANGGVVVPTFGQPDADERALQTISGIFPERKIVPVAAREIGIGGGLIHCITQQQPAGNQLA